MVVVFSQRDNVALRCDFKATTTADFHIGTLKLANKWAIFLKDSHMETVAMAVTNEDVAFIAYVNTIGEVGDVLTANTAQKLPFITEHNNTMALQQKLLT